MKNWDLINEFVKGNYKKDYRQVNNLSYRVYQDNGEYSILFSYSTAIAIRRDDFFIINNNRYSQTTSCHYGILKSILYAKQKNYVEMNFPLLYSAQVYPENLKIVDMIKFDDDYGFLKEYFILFTCNQGIDGDFYFLYGTDSGLKTRNKDFLCKLKDKVNDIEQALNNLNPIPIEERNGVLRQGEYFFQPIGNSTALKKLINEKYANKILTGKKIKSLKDYAIEQLVFPDWQDFIVNSHHRPSKLIILKDNIIFCSGQVKHTRREHKVLHLQKNIWYQMIKNTAIQSWTVVNKND
jgi:hypothetical protein